MIKKIIYLFVCVAVVSSCSSCGSKNPKGEGEFGENETATNDSALPVAKEAMEDLVQNISSPIEVTALIKSLKVPFSVKYLAPAKTDNFNTSFSKAFNLGIFAADLGYLNMYNKTSSVIQYITAMKSLADGIKVGQFFDFSTLKRLATNNENIDSLMVISQHSFSNMDEFLRKNNRSNLSALMVAGTYIEGLYILTQVAIDKPDKKLTESIGDQKTILNELMLILKNYKKDPFFAGLITDFETVQKELEPVKITVEKGEPTQAIVNGMLTVKSNDKTIIDISDEQAKRIIDQTAIIRNKLIK
jgi:hypothetical protein